MTERHTTGSTKLASYEATLGRQFGNSLLHVTDEQIILASSRRGIIFELDWDQIYTVTPRGQKLMLTWNSRANVRFTFDLKLKEEPAIVVDEMKKLNALYASRLTFLDALRKEYAQSIEQNTNKARTEFGKNESKWHQTSIPSDYQILLEPMIRPVMAPRHKSIPKKIPDKHIWNDAWYDESRKCFFTHNDIFKEIGEISSRAAQIKHKSSSGTDSVSLEGLETKFVLGYPAILLSWNGVGGEADAWTLLPTIRPEMLTIQMTLAKTNTDPSAHMINYSTDSLATYVSKFHASVSVYEAILYNANMCKHAIQEYPQLIARLNYLHENVPLQKDTIKVSGSEYHGEEHKAHEDPKFSKWMSTVSVKKTP